jgi:hypothetical protein
MKLLIAGLSAAFLTATVLPLMSSDAYACNRRLNPSCGTSGSPGNYVNKSTKQPQTTRR